MLAGRRIVPGPQEGSTLHGLPPGLSPRLSPRLTAACSIALVSCALAQLACASSVLGRQLARASSAPRE